MERKITKDLKEAKKDLSTSFFDEDKTNCPFMDKLYQVFDRKVDKDELKTAMDAKSNIQEI